MSDRTIAYDLKFLNRSTQLGRQAAISLRKSQWDNDLETPCEMRVHHLVSPKVVSRVTRRVYGRN